MLFSNLKKKIKTNVPNDILTYFNEENITNFNNYLLFNLDHKEGTFYQNLAFLADEGIWQQSELEPMTLMAQTIDNDYILATDKTVLIIPYSLNKHDSERFHLSFWDFLIQFEEKKLATTILSL